MPRPILLDSACICTSKAVLTKTASPPKVHRHQKCITTKIACASGGERYHFGMQNGIVPPLPRLKNRIYNIPNKFKLFLKDQRGQRNILPPHQSPSASDAVPAAARDPRDVASLEWAVLG